MKIKTIFLIIFSVWTLDFFTTFIALNFLEGFYESNPIPAYFFGIGWYGWIFIFILNTIGLFLVSLFVYKTSDITSRLRNDGEAFFMSYCFVGTFVILEGFVIFNNIYLML